MARNVLAVVRDILGQHLADPQLEEAPPDQVSLQSLGIASVDMISIVIDLEEHSDRPIDQTRLHELGTLADLVAALEQP